MTDSNILDVLWLNGAIGIVVVETQPIKEIKFYIGEGKGVNEEYDMRFIASWGTPVHPDSVIKFFQRHIHSPQPPINQQEGQHDG